MYNGIDSGAALKDSDLREVNNGPGDARGCFTIIAVNNSLSG